MVELSYLLLLIWPATIFLPFHLYGGDGAAAGIAFFYFTLWGGAAANVALILLQRARASREKRRQQPARVLRVLNAALLVGVGLAVGLTADILFASSAFEEPAVVVTALGFLVLLGLELAPAFRSGS